MACSDRGSQRLIEMEMPVDQCHPPTSVDHEGPHDAISLDDTVSDESPSCADSA